MSLAKVLKKLLNHCPDGMQKYFTRRMISLPEVVPANYVFKIAQTREELEASFRLVYDSYVKLGYCDPNPHKLRATVYHTLSTTTTLIALDGDTVVGTLTIVRDNILKLPLEKIFKIDCLRGKANRAAEITSLVIHPDYRREKGGAILFPLMKYMYEYSTNFFGVDHLVISIHPKDEFFYRSLMLFKRIPDTGVEDYLGAPAIALHLDLHKASQEYLESYRNYPASKNLYDFFKIRHIPNCRFPERMFDLISDPLVTSDYYESLFLEKLQMGPEIIEYFNEAFKNKELYERDCARVEVNLSTVLSQLSTEDISYLGKIKDVSMNGFRLFTSHDLPNECEFKCKIQIRPDHYANVIAKIVWKNAKVGYGLKIVQCDQSWKDFIEYLYQIHLDKVG